MRLVRLLQFLLVLTLAACSGTQQASPESSSGRAKASDLRVTVVGTNDLHGHIEALPLLAGYLQILRDDPGRELILLDAGDMFQGTLESNLQEGASVVEAYNHLGYTAAAIGNHEFDFGPVGPAATATGPDQDPRGALKARAAEAEFPFLDANILSDATGQSIRWPNVQPSLLASARGVPIGVVGISTIETPHVTLAANVVGLRMAPLAETVTAEARALRKRGAALVIVAAHAGGVCESFSDPRDLSVCEDEEIFRLARDLPPGLVDVIVGGHTHRGVAHEVNGIAIIESFSRGAAFGRVDLRLSPGGEVEVEEIHPPRFLCPGSEDEPPTCQSASYEGQAVSPDPGVAKIVAAATARADALRSRPLGVELKTAVTRSRSHASALGNLFADLMLASYPEADVSVTNGGSLRADLPAGPLTYGELFEAMPFDNRFALIRLPARSLRLLLSENLASDRGILSIAGLRAEARCQGAELRVELLRGSTPIPDDEVLTLVTSDYIASGGDGLLASEGVDVIETTIASDSTIRDAMADQLASRGGTLDTTSPAIFDPAHPRIQYPGARPVLCH